MLQESFNALNVVVRCNLYKRPLQNLLILRQRKSHADAAAAIEHRAAADYPEQEHLLPAVEKWYGTCSPAVAVFFVLPAHHARQELH